MLHLNSVIQPKLVNILIYFATFTFLCLYITQVQLLDACNLF